MAYCEHCDHCNAELMDGTNIRKVRKSQGITMRRMAADLGVSVLYISDVELNRRPVFVSRAIGAKIADYLGLRAA